MMVWSASESLDLPITYRREVVGPIMQHLLAGESCAIVGIAGSGKSNLLNMLARRDVQAHYLGAAQPRFLFVWVDFNRLAQLSEWGFWELLLHRLVTAVAGAAAGSEMPVRLATLHEQATVSRDAVVAQRRFETAVTLVAGEPDRRLVILFDQFDDVWRTLPGGVFRVLRALRDEFKYRLSYVITTRDELARLRPDLSAVEDFYELVVGNCLGLGPHSEEDARVQVARFDLRRGAALPPDQVAQLLQITGRHPGLVRVAYWALANGRVTPDQGMAEQLVADSSIREACAELWRSLDEDERAVLRRLAHGQRLTAEERDLQRLLQLKGLLVAAGDQIFSDLFAAYVRQISNRETPRLEFDPSSGRVEIDGVPLRAELSRLDIALLNHLYLRRGQVCSRQELQEALYPGDATSDEDLTARRLDSQVRRLRDKIEPDRDHPRFIITVRDRGYKLADAEADAG
jgi:DNA-binding response OmpR family regulator